MMPKLLPLICAAWFVTCHCASADDQKKRFLEFPDAPELPNARNVTTYDLNTVQLIQPGKFAIIYTLVNAPDFMRLQLKALDILRSFCTREDGAYPAPTDLLASGPPDMPIEKIEVKTNAKTKRTSWTYPYSKFALGSGSPWYDSFYCKRPFYPQDQDYRETRQAIMGGYRAKQFFDCKRGLVGEFADVNSRVTKAVIGLPPEGSLIKRIYISVCRAVTNEDPYEPRD